MNVNYVSACFDASGYADAARNNIAALDSVGVKVDVSPVSFEKYKSELGPLGEKIQGMVSRSSSAKIQITHTTPNIWGKVMNRSRYNIGYTTWETDRLPDEWVDSVNMADEIWVPCQQNVEVFKSSGVTKPIYCFPHSFNTDLFDQQMQDIQLQNVGSGDFTFYSIFQWTERKNPMALLKAYLTEFRPDEKVCLLLKTYLVDPNNEQEKAKIKGWIQEVKDRLYLKHYPKMLLISSLLSKPQIHKLHKLCDCYVSLHRNEGFGIPLVEAMMAKKPVIYTDYGGPVDFLSETCGYPVNYFMTPCFGMPWETYNGRMNWADVDIMDARHQMRTAFQNQEEATKRGMAGRQYVETNLAWQKIGALMKARLEQI